MELYKTIFQHLAIYSFVALTIAGIVEKDWNFGFLLNFALVILYVALYLQPFK